MAAAPSAAPTFLSLQEVADVLAVSYKTVRRFIERGELPRHKIGRQIRISQRDLRDFITLRRGF